MRRRTMVMITIITVTITIALSYVLLPKTYVQTSIGKLTLNVPIPYGILGATLTAIAIAAELLPLSITEYRLWRINNEIILDMPAVVRVIRDGLGSGQSLVGVAEMLTRVGKGRLGRIVAESIRKESMGVTTMREDLTRASEEFSNNYLAMLAVIIDTAVKSGGAKLQETLDMAYKSFEDLVSYQLEKANQVKPYLALIYTVMIVYIVLAGIVMYLMMPSIGRMVIGGVPASAITTPPAVPPPIDVQLFSSVLIMSSTVQAVLAGAIIGRVVYGRSVVGLLHASILMIALSLINYSMYLMIYLHVI